MFNLLMFDPLKEYPLAVATYGTRLMTIKEVCAHLEIETWELIKLRRLPTNALKTRKRGGNIRFYPKDLDRFVSLYRKTAKARLAADNFDF